MLKDTRFLVIDTETTGIDPKVDRVVSIAGVLVAPGQGRLRVGQYLVDPGIPIPPEASAIHHITDRHVAGALALDDALPMIGNAAQPYQCLAAHNAAFDFGFVNPGDTPILCTWRLAKKLWPDFPSHSNQYLRYKLELDVPEVEGLAAHSAEPDAIVTAALLERELQEVAARSQNPKPIDLLEFIQWVNKPIIERTCRFGKHKDTPWADVPKPYLRWMLREMKDMSIDQKATVEFHLGTTRLGVAK